MAADITTVVVMVPIGVVMMMSMKMMMMMPDILEEIGIEIIIIIHIILDIEDLTHRGNIIIGETEITTIQIIEIIVTATMTLITKIIHTITITIEEIIIMAIIQILTMDEMVVGSPRAVDPLRCRPCLRFAPWP